MMGGGYMRFMFVPTGEFSVMPIAGLHGCTQPHCLETAPNHLFCPWPNRSSQSKNVVNTQPVCARNERTEHCGDCFLGCGRGSLSGLFRRIRKFSYKLQDPAVSNLALSIGNSS